MGLGGDCGGGGVACVGSCEMTDLGHRAIEIEIEERYREIAAKKLRLTFERDFLRLAAVALGCHLRAMGGDFICGVPKHDLAFSCLGIKDYCGEMKLLCREFLTPLS
jgi:hypothetical protein